MRIRGLCVCVFLFLVLLVCIVLEAAAFAVLFFAPRRARAINGRITAFYWRLCATLPEKLYGVEYRITGDPPVAGENSIWICNHRADGDIPALWRLGVEWGRPQDVKFFAKRVLKSVPGIGWGMQLTGQIFLARRWSEDQAILRSAFERFKKENIPLLLMLFPEGTRFAPDKLGPGSAGRWTRVLPPRAKGFIATVTELRDYCSSVCDITLAYEGHAGTFPMLYGGGVSRIHLHVRRYPLKDFPVDAPAIEAWLTERFLEKEAFLGRYYPPASPAA
ncbi:MAG TPA: lysophospholipid acyltransferase family protein [Myxococcales bacterium]|nr:lysophospholipid acyltransferase family protein [Myxococcales bacterium]